MGLRIGTNISAQIATRNLEGNIRAESNSVQKLSSGSRIVHAGDDAAGLAVSENMRADIRSQRQAVRNVQDGISMIQVAEGSMAEVSNMVIRIRELSTQAASDTVGDVQRGFIDKEVQQLVSEIGRIADTAEYNGQKLLNNGPKYLEVQAGIHNDADADRLYLDIWKGNNTPKELGLTGISVTTASSARENLEVVDHALSRISKSRAMLGSVQNRMQSAMQSGEIFAENMSASESRIRDTDVAAETAEMTKANILVKANIAVLGQANLNDKLALKLLG